MNRLKKEKDLVLNDWHWIYANQGKFNLISDIKQPIMNTSTVGVRVEHIKPNNYTKIHTEALCNERYAICLIDDSLICFHYIFDKKDNIVGHSIMYIPTPIDEDAGTKEDTACAKYIRIDFDQANHKELVHTQVHMHIGVYKTGFRIPISHYFTPKDFLYLILKYVYHSEEEIVEKLLDDKDRKSFLTEEEKKRLVMVLGI